MPIIEKALEFALIAHEGQVRKQTTIPYITHPIAVGFLLQKYSYSEETIAAGILHDVLEDTKVTYEQLEAVFGFHIARLVEEASEEDKSLPWNIRKEQTVQRVSSLTANGAAIVCADKLHNLTSIEEAYHEIGDKVWERFTKGQENQNWYYQSLATQLYRTKTERKMLLAFDQLVQRVFGQNKNLPFKEIDQYFQYPYGVDEPQLIVWENNLVHHKKAAVYRRLTTLSYQQDERIFSLLDYLQQCGIEFQSNSDGPSLIGSLGVSLMENYHMSEIEVARHMLRNIDKL